MKKVSSVVWRFFERIEENNRCVAVVCKLCESQYKYFGNTTNLRVHLINKHPIQWKLSEDGSLDESSLRLDETVSQSPQKRKFGSRPSKKNVGYSVSIDKKEEAGAMPRIEIQRVNVLENSDSEGDQETLNLVRQMHGDQNSAEEWLEDDPYQITHIETYEPKAKRRNVKYHKIKREVISPTDLSSYYVAPKSKPIVYEEPARKDEYSVFGEYIANKLRKLKKPKTQGNLQQLITTILWQAEYGLYDNTEAVKRVLMMTLPEKTTTVDNDYEAQNLQAQVVEQEEIIEQSAESLEPIM